MANTFDIRFARTAGLAALFEAPANRFRWKGAGRLSIDAEGISIAVKRGLLSWFARRSRRIPAGDITEVYREGDALRLEFGTAAAREVLPIWAAGSDTAAEIVKLLPTSRTVELEQSPAPVPAYRFDWPVIAGICAVSAALALGWWLLQREPVSPAPLTEAAETTPTIERDLPSAAAPEATAPASTPSASTRDARTGRAQPLAKDSPAYGAARAHLVIFEVELADRIAEYLEWLKSPSPVELEALEPRWQRMIERINGDMNYQGPELWLMRDVQLGICRDWQKFLLMFAVGLRSHDSAWVSLAFSQRADADAATEWLRWYVPYP
jgi:hypothetical protein